MAAVAYSVRDRHTETPEKNSDKNAPSTCTKRPQTKTPSGKRRQDKMLLFYYSLKE